MHDVFPSSKYTGKAVQELLWSLHMQVYNITHAGRKDEFNTTVTPKNTFKY